MKTLRDTNNNNSNTTNNTIQHSNISSTNTHHHHFLTSNGLIHHNSNIDIASYPSLLTQNSQTNWRTNNVPPQNQNNLNSNPLSSLSNSDPNQFSSLIQTYLSKFGGNQIFQFDTINPLIYFQLMNANTMFMQQLSTPNDLLTETINSGRKSQILHADSNIFVPKTRPMTQTEIAEHARLVYQRALQRNQLQQHNDLMKHFYETLNIKQQNSNKSINHNDVPSVPNVSNIASIGTYDILDTMITSPSSCLSIKEPSINAVVSSLSLLSVDDTKMISNTSSILDPSAPIFIPRQSRLKLDDEHETSSSSSDSDFNDFHYLDQFLEEYYNSDNEQDNHIIIRKSHSSNIVDEILNTNNKYSINHHILGQGDAIEQKSDEIIEPSSEKSECQYSIYELLHRYRNPRCHLVLPEWSRLSLILSNVCSMRSHTYKIKRYFAYRRRLSEDQNLTNVSVQG